MKRIVLSIGLLFCFVLAYSAQPFRFALLTDLHIQMALKQPDEDLMLAVEELNATDDIDFVLLAGDITEFGDRASLLKAKRMLDNLHMPYYISAGNHDAKWSHSAGVDFKLVFGDDKFSFAHKGIFFLGFTSSTVVKMSEGHIAPQDIRWVGEQLKLVPNEMPVIALTHYPLQGGDVDNWFDMTDLLRQHNTQAILGGHYHRNAIFSYDGIAGIVNRSTLRNKEPRGGYSMYEISDSIVVYEKVIATEPTRWLALPIEIKAFDAPDFSLRPSYSMNNENKNVSVKWRFDTHSAIYSAPTYQGQSVFFGDDLGWFYALNSRNGKLRWKFKTQSRIVSTAAVSQGKVVFGSTDGYLYCLTAKTGSLVWKYKTPESILASPLIQNDTVFFGGSDGSFRALNLNTAKLIWSFNSVGNYVESHPVFVNGSVVFGAWDGCLYALDVQTGQLNWKWKNPNAAIYYSPAAVIPVVAHNKVFVSTLDGYVTAIDTQHGEFIWRSNQYKARESLGTANDAQTLYCKNGNAKVYAFDAQSDKLETQWESEPMATLDHNSAALTEISNSLVFGTQNGLLVGLNSQNGKLQWRYKFGNTLINSLAPVSHNKFVLSTTDGQVALIKFQ